MRRNLRQDFIFLANPHIHLIASGCNGGCRRHRQAGSPKKKKRRSKRSGHTRERFRSSLQGDKLSSHNALILRWYGMSKRPPTPREPLIYASEDVGACPLSRREELPGWRRRVAGRRAHCCQPGFSKICAPSGAAATPAGTPSALPIGPLHLGRAAQHRPSGTARWHGSFRGQAAAMPDD